MKKVFYVVLLALLALTILIVWCLHGDRDTLVREGFEQGFGAWVRDADVPLDPNHPGHPVEWNITREKTIVHSGEHALKFFIDGRQDDGTIWVERTIEATENGQIPVTISLEF